MSACSGHAIEARLYAEDPYADFAPQTGTVRWWRPDAATAEPGVRIDHGIAEGSVVSPFYDAMVAKVIVHGRDRDDAIRRLRAALVRAPLLGLPNNGRFLADLVDHASFRAGSMTTTLIEEWSARGEPLLQRPRPDRGAWRVAAAAFALHGGPGWRADSVASFDLRLDCAGEQRALRVQVGRDGRARVTDEGEVHDVRILRFAAGDLHYEQDGVRRRAVALMRDGELHFAGDAASFVFREPSALPQHDAGVDAQRARAPLAGSVAQVLVRAGERVAPGQRLVCIEAMKMETWVSAQADATVAAVHVREGEQVAPARCWSRSSSSRPRDKFCSFKHLLVAGLAGHSDEALARHLLLGGGGVLDVGSGFGDSTRRIAGLVGPRRRGGRRRLRRANFIEELASREQPKPSIENASFFVADAQTDDLRGPYERAFARFGTMFFNMPGAAMSDTRQAPMARRRAHEPGWRRREDNPWLQPCRAARGEIVPVVAHEDTDQVHCGPGPFSMAGADMVSSDAAQRPGYDAPASTASPGRRRGVSSREHGRAPAAARARGARRRPRRGRISRGCLRSAAARTGNSPSCPTTRAALSSRRPPTS